MDVATRIEYRKVRNIRLEYDASGLRVIVPLKFNGDIQQVVARHAGWIARRQKQVEQTQTKRKELVLEHRTDQLLRIAINNFLAQSASALSVKPEQVKYRSMKSRWGSCSSRKVITFSTKLKYLPDNLVAFVVHHEMTHLKVMKHNAVFWNYMAQTFPNYQELRKQLHHYGFVVNR